MSYLSKEICLIIPCYNEGKRLDFKEFKKFKSSCYFLFVNDGSKDNTLDLIKKNIEEGIYVLDLPKNVGKGEAIRQGILYLENLGKQMHIFY